MKYKRENISLRGIQPRLGITLQYTSDQLFNIVGRNTGNLLFTYAIARLLKFPLWENWTQSYTPPRKLFVYALANQLGKHFNPLGLAKFWRSLPEEVKILGVGLGAQPPLNMDPKEFIEKHLTRNHKEFIKALADRAPSNAPNIAVRGYYTYEVLTQMGFGNKAVPLGCPSFTLSPWKDLGKKIYERYELTKNKPVIHFSLGAPWNKNQNKFELKGINLAINSGGKVHVQSTELYVKFARGEELKQNEIMQLSHQLKVPGEKLQDLSKHFFRVWFDVPPWLEYLYQNADFMIGTRIHGCIAAIQAGVPTLCVTPDMRVKELCEILKIPHVSLYDEPWRSGSYTWEDIKREFEKQFDPAEFDKNREKIINGFLEFLRKNKIEL